MNPLVRAGLRTLSKNPQEHRETPLEPVLEDFSGPVFPYRGMEDHGINPPNKPRQPIGYDGDIAANFEPEPPNPDPVPVVIVSAGGRELRRWTNHFVSAGPIASLLLSRRENRIKARLKNKGNLTVLLAPENSISAATAYALAPGETFETGAEAEIWGQVVAAPTDGSAGGWVNLVPRQVVNGATAVQGSPFSVKGFTRVRLVLKIYSMTGTTPKIQGMLYASDWIGNLVGGGTIASTSILAVSTSIQLLIDPLAEDYVRGGVFANGASGDSAVDCELWGYFAPDNSTTDTISMLDVYQEVSFKE